MFVAPGWGAARLLPSVVSEMLTPGPEGSKKTYCAPAGDAIYQLTLHKCATSPMGERGSKNASTRDAEVLSRVETRRFNLIQKRVEAARIVPTARWETYNKRGVFLSINEDRCGKSRKSGAKAFRAAADKNPKVCY